MPGAGGDIGSDESHRGFLQGLPSQRSFSIHSSDKAFAQAPKPSERGVPAGFGQIRVIAEPSPTDAFGQDALEDVRRTLFAQPHSRHRFQAT